MGDFNRYIECIIAEEGGLSTHCSDPGGLAKFGIFQRAYRIWRLPAGYEINRNEDVFGKGWFRRLFRRFALAQAGSRLG